MKQFVCLSLALFATIAMAQPHHYSAPSYHKEASHKVHQVSLEGLSKLTDIAAIEKYLNAPAHHQYDEHKASYAQAKYVAAASAPVPGKVFSKSYSAAPSAHHGYGGDHYSAAPAVHTSYSAPAAYTSYSAPAVHTSYSAPAVHTSYSAPATYSAPAAHYPAHTSYSAPATSYEAPNKYGYTAHSAPKYSVLPSYVTQINAGKNDYKTYQTPIKYSTVTLPVAPAGPVANLYVPEHSSYGHSSSHSSYSGTSY